MGCNVNAKCLDCGNKFNISKGDGFFFHLLRCQLCGETKSIGFEKLGELRLQYLKGLSGPTSIPSMEYDKHIQQYARVEPISEDKYRKEVEAFAGKCKCGGNFAFNAFIRCPKCRSVRIEEGGITMMYD